MNVVKTIADLRVAVHAFRTANPDGRLGFVPTMGALHEGHLSLLQESKRTCDSTLASIFINPTQFNDPRDLERYPVTEERDLELCEQEGADLVFMPSRQEMNLERAPLLTLSMPSLTNTLCGSGRPGHFEGVLFIVARLFNLVQPDVAFFGKKDYQQLTVIQRMAEELSFPVEVVGCETLREEDGLAMSSRNALLAPADREHANLIYRALKMGKRVFEDRDVSQEELVEIVSDVISSGSRNRVEYVDVVDLETLERLETLEDVERFLIGTAVFCGSVRLIDNIECG